MQALKPFFKNAWRCFSDNYSPGGSQPGLVQDEAKDDAVHGDSRSWASCFSINHYERTAQEADPSFLYPAHFNHYTMICSRGSIISFKASWSPPWSPYSHTRCFVFLFKLLEFQTGKGSNALTCHLWETGTLWSLYLTHPLQGETHFIKQKYLRKVRKYSFKPW